MGIRKDTSLNAVAATGAGKTLKLTSELKVCMQLTGTFVGTVALEGTIDGTTFVSLGTATAPGFVVPTNANEVYSAVRANVTVFTSGNITALIAVG